MKMKKFFRVFIDYQIFYFIPKCWINFCNTSSHYTLVAFISNIRSPRQSKNNEFFIYKHI